jgi:TatD family-associated radical SAM protein
MAKGFNLVYTVHGPAYITIEDLIKEMNGDIKTTAVTNKVYINLTNRCSCSCTFCLRATKELDETNTLWLSKEPEAGDVITEMERFDFSKVPEFIFCGFGEPMYRKDAIIEIAKYIRKKYPNALIRINTNGHGNLIYGKHIEEEFENLIDTFSISLNSSNAKEYQKLTRSQYGEESFDAMLDFARDSKKYIPNVVLTVVDIIGEEEIAKCQKICDDRGVTLRVRPFE